MKMNYIPYNVKNIEHEFFLAKIKEENKGYTFFDLKQNLFIIQNNYDHVGIIAINKRSYKKDSITIDIAILNEFRKRGYGTQVLDEMGEHLLEKQLCERVILEISLLNFNSIKAALKAGYKVDEQVLEVFRNEDYRYVPYSKINRTKQK